MNAPAVLGRRVASLVRAIEENDEASIERAVLRLSGSHRAFAPLAFAVSAFVLLFDGLRLVVSNWRLMLVQILPAMWIWLAMFDLKLHTLHGRSFNVVRGPILIPIGLLVVALTVASFLLNALFAFAVTQSRTPSLSTAAAKVRAHRAQIAGSGAIVGAALAFATLVVPRWGRPWFGLVLGTVAGVMMLCYVAVPARIIGVKPIQSRRDKLWTSVVGGVLGATVCTPPYVLGRVGILMLGSKVLLIPGVFLIAIGVTLQAGATGAVRAIKMSASLTPRERAEARRRPTAARSSGGASEQPQEEQEHVEDVEEDAGGDRHGLSGAGVAQTIEVEHGVQAEDRKTEQRPDRVAGWDPHEDQENRRGDQPDQKPERQPVEERQVAPHPKPG
jgi:hypothetical protein